MRACSCRTLGRCVWAMALALVFDVVGLVMILIGVFAASIAYYDFLIYTGAIIIFISIILWLFWFMGNISATDTKYDADGVSFSVGEVARSWLARSVRPGHDQSRRAKTGHLNGSYRSNVGFKNGELPGVVLPGPTAHDQLKKQFDTMATTF